jgi:hypothetical protein
MERRSSEHPEPSHIHVPRPSRVSNEYPNPADMIDRCALLIGQCGETSNPRDAD